MKSLKVAMAILMLVLLIGVGASYAEITDEGEFCWEYVDSEGDTGSLKLGFLSTGDGHFLWSGVSFCPTGTFPAFGNAEVINGRLQLIYTQAGTDGNAKVWTNIGNCHLNVVTLEGTCSVRQVMEVAGEPVTKDLTSTLTPVDCP
jgi:hypothetical protein